MQSFSISQVTIEDIHKVINLFDAYRVFYGQPSQPEQAKLFLMERIKRKESIIFVVEHEGVAVGFTQLYPLFSSVRMCPVLLLNDLYVDKSHRRKGMAQKLILHCQALVKQNQYGGLMLETARTNVEGNTLYPKMGFELDGDTNHYQWVP